MAVLEARRQAGPRPVGAAASVGETARKAMFTGPDGDFFKGIWKSRTKNW
ncbi:MAG TPA: hypothetical protein VF395_14980 [Polyangiaceae bacterium]